MTTSRSRLLAAALLLLTAPSRAQLDPRTTDARAVLEAVERADTGDRAVARLRMVITDAAGHRRERVLQTRALRFEGGTKSLMFVESPADVRGTGFLSVDHRAAGRDDEQWLFVPSLARATRIAASGRSGAFLGSDFSYGDLTSLETDDFDVRMVAADEAVDGEACFHLEATPKTASIRQRIGYTRLELWVSKRSTLPIRSKGYLADGRVKYIALLDVRNVSGVWTAHRLVARTVRGSRRESETVLERQSLRYGDAGVTDADFTVARLERGL